MSQSKSAQNSKQTKTRTKKAKFKYDNISHVTSLPFISSKQGIPGRNWFDIKPTGDYGKDCEAGKVAAIMLFKAMRDDKEEYTGGDLQQIVLALASRDLQENGKGLIVGFFSYLDFCLRVTATRHASKLDELNYDDLIAEFESYLGGKS